MLQVGKDRYMDFNSAETLKKFDLMAEKSDLKSSINNMKQQQMHLAMSNPILFQEHQRFGTGSGSLADDDSKLIAKNDNASEIFNIKKPATNSEDRIEQDFTDVELNIDFNSPTKG